MRGLGHVLSGAVSAVVVLAAFGGLLVLTGRVMGSRSRSPYPRLYAPGYRPGWPAWPLTRAAWWLLLAAARFAADAPLSGRRTDATFLTPGTKPIDGVPGWFTTGQPGRRAYLPGWKCAAVHRFVAAAGLCARPLVTGAVLGWMAIASTAAGWPRFRRWRYERTVGRPVYLQLCGYLGTEPGEWPGRWLDIPRGFADDQDARVTLAYPPTWNPTRRNKSKLTRSSAGTSSGDLVGAFGPHHATWAHPPAPPRVNGRSPATGHTLAVRINH